MGPIFLVRCRDVGSRVRPSVSGGKLPVSASLPQVPNYPSYWPCGDDGVSSLRKLAVSVDAVNVQGRHLVLVADGRLRTSDKINNNNNNNLILNIAHSPENAQMRFT